MNKFTVMNSYKILTIDTNLFKNKHIIIIYDNNLHKNILNTNQRK